MSENQETPQSDVLPPNVMGEREEARENQVERGVQPDPHTSVKTAPDEAPPPGPN